MNPHRKVAYMGLYSAAAILLGYIEMMIPVSAAVPGMKLGLPNLAVVAVLYLYSWREALAVSVIRIFIIGLLFGNFFSICFSLAGGLFSLLCMALVKHFDLFSCTGVSLVGGLAHNAGQIAAAILLVENARIAYYFIPLAVTGIITGIVIGIVSGIMIRRLAKVAPIF